MRLYGITESVRDLVGGILEMYLSAINNRMNEIMKTFTLITTLFMPISFIVGFFGMNFFAPSRRPAGLDRAARPVGHAGSAGSHPSPDVPVAAPAPLGLTGNQADSRARGPCAAAYR